MATNPRSPLAGLPPGLVRRRDERVVAGVCAGVARWIGVDPTRWHQIVTVVVVAGLMADECRELLQDFFRQRR